jgi:RNA polymerase sigma-70 factor (ECF subfamily)
MKRRMPAGPEQELFFASRMRKAQQGDGAAYRELLEEVQSALEGYFVRALLRTGLGDRIASEDLVQETLLAIHAKRHTYDGEQPFGPWLFAIARYKLIDASRALRGNRFIPFDEELESVLAAPETGEPGAAADVAKLLGELPEKQRRALELVKLDGRSIRQAAKTTGMSESAIKVSIHRALKALKRGRQE